MPRRASLVLLALLALPARAAAHDNHVVKLLAGSPGYDHIQPRVGLAEKDVQLALVPVPEVATAIITGDVWAAFPFEPYGTSAVQKGARLLLAAKDMIDKSKIQSDMLRNGLVMHRKFLKEHPDLAKKIV